MFANKKFFAIAMVVVLLAAAMPAQAQTKEQWAATLTELYLKNQFLQAAGLPTIGQDLSAWGNAFSWMPSMPDWGSWGGAVPFLGGRKLLAAME